LVCSETVYDVTMATGVRFLDVPSGGTVRFHTRTRILERTPETGNRLVRTARIGAMPAGQLVLRSTIPPVNGCIQPGGPAVAIQVQSPVGGPDPAHWILYGVVGRVNTLEACGAPIAPDVSEWFLGAGSLGLAAFPLRGSFFGGTGGGSSVTPVPLISSVPLAALLPGPPAVPAFNTIVNLPVVPFSYTLQGVMQDATSPGGFRVTNALEVSGTACTCQP
jgi:hypothetical protein